VCAIRAVQFISFAAFPPTSIGILSVTSNRIPTCSGADEAKKNPPRETFNASVKCSLVSVPAPSAQNLNGVCKL
jgi:hypothetical protein